MRADACDACLEVGSLAARQAQGSVPRQQCLTAAHAHAGHTVKLALLLKARVLAIPSKQVAAETCLLGISVISSSSSVPDWKALVAETRRRGRPGRPPDFDAADWSDMPSIPCCQQPQRRTGGLKHVLCPHSHHTCFQNHSSAQRRAALGLLLHVRVAEILGACCATARTSLAARAQLLS